MTNHDCDVRDLLNAQTARIEWGELERHFARGVVLCVSSELDLVEVAATVVEDDSARFSDWLESDAVATASVDQAREWANNQGELWAVVAAPWVLVQDRG